MRPFNMSDEEKERLLKQHKEATKQENEKRATQKAGILAPKKEED